MNLKLSFKNSKNQKITLGNDNLRSTQQQIVSAKEIKYFYPQLFEFNREPYNGIQQKSLVF